MKRMQVMFGKRRAMVLVTLVVLVLAAAALIASSASFTATSANPNNVFTAGSLYISNEDTAGNSREGVQVLNLTASAMKPGDVVTGTAVIGNSGTSSSAFHASSTTSGNAAFASYLDLVVTEDGQEILQRRVRRHDHGHRSGLEPALVTGLSRHRNSTPMSSPSPSLMVGSASTIPTWARRPHSPWLGPQSAIDARRDLNFGGRGRANALPRPLTLGPPPTHAKGHDVTTRQLTGTKAGKGLLSLLVLALLALTLQSVVFSGASFTVGSTNPGECFHRRLLVAYQLKPWHCRARRLQAPSGPEQERHADDRGGGSVTGAYTISKASVVDTPALPGLSNALILLIRDVTGAPATLYNNATLRGLLLGARRQHRTGRAEDV